MRLAVLGDIHGNLNALEAAWADVQARGEFDEVWVPGDLAAFGPRPAECVRRVLELRSALGDEKLRVIGGNTDRYLVHGTRPSWTPAAGDEAALRGLAPAWQARDRALNWAVEQLGWEEYDFLRSILGRELRLQTPGYGPVIGYHAIPGDDESMALRPDSPDEEAQDALLDREGAWASAATPICRWIATWGTGARSMSAASAGPSARPAWPNGACSPLTMTSRPLSCAASPGMCPPCWPIL